MKSAAHPMSFPWHPFVWGMLYVLSIYQINSEHHPLSVIWIPLGVALSVLALFFFVCSLLARSVRGGALICSTTVINLMLLPVFRKIVLKITGADFSFPIFSVLLVGQLLFLWALGRERRTSVIWVKTFNMVGICCFASVAFSVASPLLLRRNVARETMIKEAEVSPVTCRKDAPDIYCIILDGYARNDVLQQVYSFDNRGLLAALNSNGFYVAEQAYANYCQTGLSVSSALNFQYLEPSSHYEKSDDRKVLQQLIHSSRLPALLHESGYQLRLYESGYYLTGSIAQAELVETTDIRWNEFDYELIRKVTHGLPAKLRNKMMRSLAAKTLFPQHEMRVERAFSLLKKEPVRADAPTFTFVHILAPHPPFIFSEPRRPLSVYNVADGSHIVPWMKGGAEEYRQLYVSQLQYINRRITASVEAMVEHASRPLVVVVQSDHGPGSELNWEDILASNPAERLGILNAVYFSDGDYSGLHQSISPVNTWRVILNKYLLEDDIPLLEEKSFLSSWNQPYVFHEYDRGDAGD